MDIVRRGFLGSLLAGLIGVVGLVPRGGGIFVAVCPLLQMR
ncbi:MAG: hypothetical protein OEU26_03235 [Candidatus Tectomicrobia bacterium]|nr:hypothetical protein [Candidatus Tectomicrobia bacterium]